MRVRDHLSIRRRSTTDPDEMKLSDARLKMIPLLACLIGYGY